ncbi:MAG: hypothetical protein R2828_33460 [Saprospiraceae bacterium]
MKKFYLFFLLIFFGQIIFAQRLEEFSKNPTEFMSQLGSFMTSGKQKALEDTFKEFELVFKSGMFVEEEVEQILKTSNSMLALRMTANPYFGDYFGALLKAKQGLSQKERFKEWHSVVEDLLADNENRTNKDFQEFLRFSATFFEHHAIRYSDTGTSWYGPTDKFSFAYADHKAKVSFEQLDLVAVRQQDSLLIYETAGDFFPTEGIWKGKGGKATWEKAGLDAKVNVDLGNYELEVKKSLYKVDTAYLYYPLFFGEEGIMGSFSDKLVPRSDVTSATYPRFESYEARLQVDNLGQGVEYIGGIRLQGTTLYGFGSKEERARITLLDNEDKVIFKGDSELFTIRREERIVGERVEAILYFGNDSLYHPSVNLRFEIPTKEIQLSRGQRGSDRNPFFDSLHEVNIDAETINAYIGKDSIVIGKPAVSISSKEDVYFESFGYFNLRDFERFQNIATSNPIAIIKATAENEGTNFIDANLLAKRINASFTVDNIQSLLYNLVGEGFINYDSDKQLVEVKEKVLHYTNASRKQVDYDALRIKSATRGTNGVFNLKDDVIQIEGVKNIEFSPRQKVAIMPEESQLTLKSHRDIDFNGRIFAGYSILEGKDFHFDYDKFMIELDSVEYFDLYVPTGEDDRGKEKTALALGSRIEQLKGVLLIDAPSNKSGKDDIAMFPSLRTRGYSYVFYEGIDSIKTYPRDSFFFQLEAFSFNQLDGYSAKDIKFQGTMKSSSIFPDFQETLKLRDEDLSLGFSTQTPEKGYPAYKGKGNYTGAISLSNKGLQGQGDLKYLNASIHSEDIQFMPKQALASAERFDLEEIRGGIEVPQVRGEEVKIDWRPYRDSMYVTPRKEPFALFKNNNHTFQGVMILTPDGLKGNGLFDWDKASMRSNLFSFGAFSADADTTNLSIKAFDAGELALTTTNVKGMVDFEDQIGTFKANDEFLVTTLPYNKYITSMNEFDWDMKEETITFKTEEDKLGSFTSIHPEQDSLQFKGKAAFYDLKSSLLNISGVPYVVAADAFIYPDSGLIEVQPGGYMAKLENSKIIADTINQYHVINRASIEILGRRMYKASGFYEYNIGDREQEIDLQNIVGQPVGKGSWKEKRMVTRATGKVNEIDDFYIDHKTSFKGTISLNAESKNLKFDGFARLDADKLHKSYWFTISNEGDKNDLAIRFDEPKSFEGDPLQTGLFLSKETTRIYPRVMAPLTYRKDRAIFPVTGILKYDKEKDNFVFGDSLKVVTNEGRGNKLVFKNKTGQIEAEGRFNIGSGLKYIKVDAAGIAKTEIPPPPVEQKEENLDMMAAEEDTMALKANLIPEIPLDADLMVGVQLIVPEPLLKIMVTDIQSSGFDARNIAYLTDINFYKRAAFELFAPNKEVKEAIDGISSGMLDIPKKFNPYTFLFSRLKLNWDPDYQSFLSNEKKIGVTSINGEPINKLLDCFIEIKMPSGENDDRLYIYLKSPSELYYYFGFKQGILEVTSNNPSFMEALAGLKNKDLVLKMPDGETYEIQGVEASVAKVFLRRIQAAGK